MPSTIVQYLHREKSDGDCEDKLVSCLRDAHIRTEGMSSANEEKQPETEKTQEEPKEGHIEHENNQGEITELEIKRRTNQNRQIPRNKTSR